MPSGNLQELIDTLLEAVGILLPHQVMQEDAHGVHPDVLSPTELFVNLRSVERRRLPYLQLVDCVFRDIVAPDRRRMIPIASLVIAFSGSLPAQTSRWSVEKAKAWYDQQPWQCSSFKS